MRAYRLLREVGGGWALEFESFLGPVKWHQVDRRVPFGAQKTPSHFPTHPKHYAWGCIRRINRLSGEGLGFGGECAGLLQ